MIRTHKDCEAMAIFTLIFNLTPFKTVEDLQVCVNPMHASNWAEVQEIISQWLMVPFSPHTSPTQYVINFGILWRKANLDTTRSKGRLNIVFFILLVDILFEMDMWTLTYYSHMFFIQQLIVLPTSGHGSPLRTGVRHAALVRIGTSHVFRML